ncbi:hypothetical protein ACFCYN_18715 [Gottfriedia sp. NPDC056225]|uniref:hypothetical protein n=1 Tax=Gottfriedia sp. NPDC056225 TaxID=3345751 RepID=UPI0035E12690
MVELELNKKERKRYDKKFKLLDALLSSERLEDQPYGYDQVIDFADDVKILLVILEERWEEVVPSGHAEEPGAISAN